MLDDDRDAPAGGRLPGDPPVVVVRSVLAQPLELGPAAGHPGQPPADLARPPAPHPQLVPSHRPQVRVDGRRLGQRQPQLAAQQPGRPLDPQVQVAEGELAPAARGQVVAGPPLTARRELAGHDPSVGRDLGRCLVAGPEPTRGRAAARRPDPADPQLDRVRLADRETSVVHPAGRQVGAARRPPRVAAGQPGQREQVSRREVEQEGSSDPAASGSAAPSARPKRRGVGSSVSAAPRPRRAAARRPRPASALDLGLRLEHQPVAQRRPASPLTSSGRTYPRPSSAAAALLPAAARSRPRRLPPSRRSAGSRVARTSRAM